MCFFISIYIITQKENKKKPLWAYGWKDEIWTHTGLVPNQVCYQVTPPLNTKTHFFRAYYLQSRQDLHLCMHLLWLSISMCVPTSPLDYMNSPCEAEKFPDASWWVITPSTYRSLVGSSSTAYFQTARESSCTYYNTYVRVKKIRKQMQAFED